MKLYRLDTSHWYVARAVFVLAGVVNLLVLAAFLATGNPWWFLITGLVALMQINFALTGWCPSAMLLRVLGIAEN
ncbi:MAG TPA: DUF2892 domain-containing protein [Candidatus Paceibacterota bacterium]